MKNINLSKLAVISIAAASLLLSSCINDDFRFKHKKLGYVTLEVDANSGVETKSARDSYEQFETVDLSTEDFPLFLTGTKSLFNSNIEQPLATKGTVVTTENINQEGQEFLLNVLLNSDGSDYSNGQRTVTYGENNSPSLWAIGGDDINWPDDDALDFWAYKNSDNAELLSDEDGNITSYSSFSYHSINPGTEANDAEKMSDFLVANTVNQVENEVPIHFYHALAAVRFNIAKEFIDDTFTSKEEKDKDGNTVTNKYSNQYKQIKVRISGIKNSGNGQFGKGEGYVNNFKWDIPEEAEEVAYEQILFDSSNKDYYVEKSETGQYVNTEESKYSRTFFFIPQVLSSNILFTFYIVNNAGKEYILSTKTIGTDEYQAGYIYNYTIGKDKEGTVGIKVKEGDFTERTTKTNVKVELTKSATAFVRVAVIANWYASTRVYAPYSGEIEYNENDWAYNPYDHYYYSKYPILGHTESDNLIGKFTCPDDAPESPYAKLHLEMNIISQAVSCDSKGDNPYYTVLWAWFSDLDDDTKAKQEAWFSENISPEIKAKSTKSNGTTTD